MLFRSSSATNPAKFIVKDDKSNNNRRVNVTLKIDLYSWRLLVYWTGIQFIAGYPLPFPSIFSGFHDSSIVPLLLGEEKHCESKVHGQKMQHNDPARS